MKKSPQPRNHHFNPRCWLSGFSQEGTNSGRLFVTDLCRRKQWQSSPNNAGYMRDLYRQSGPTLDPNSIEKYFGDVESRMAPLLKKLDREHRGPDDHERDAVLELMAYHPVRVPSIRKRNLEINKRHTAPTLKSALENPDSWAAALKAGNLDPTSPAALFDENRRIFESGDWNVATQPDLFILFALRLVPRIHELLRERVWSQLISPRGRLITSDTPVRLAGEHDQSIGFRNAEFFFRSAATCR
jgi:hypothetical protein